MSRGMKAAVVAMVVAGALAVAGPAAAAPTWAPAASAPIHPGVQTFTDGGQCTANFVFYDATDIYIGQAAHCSGTGGSDRRPTAATPARSRSARRSRSTGASRPGTLAYSSWITMQAAGGDRRGHVRSTTTSRSSGSTRPTTPRSTRRSRSGAARPGSPTRSRRGAKVLSYGNSSLRGGITQLSPKEGVSLGQSGGGWTHSVFTVSPGIPGDSGSAFIDKQGRAFGALSTLQIAPLAGLQRRRRPVARAGVHALARTAPNVDARATAPRRSAGRCCRVP